MKKNLFGYWVMLIVAGLVFFILNLYTPFQHDDYAYCFYYDNNSSIVRPTDIWVTDFWQMVKSMWNHYLSVNGRFSSHLLLQYFCSFAGKGCFNVCNSIIFILFLHSAVTLSGWRKSVLILAIVFLLSLSLLPFPGQTMLWMAGSLNYLWPTTLSFLYIQWLRNGIDKRLSIFGHIVAFIVCVMVGWSNESVSVPFTVGLLLFFVLNREKFKGGVISSFAGYATGAGLIVVSPGTYARVLAEQASALPSDVIQSLFHRFYALAWGYVNCVLPLITVIVLVVVLFRSDNKIELIKRNLMGLLLISFTAFLFLLDYDQIRVFFCVSALCMIVLLRLLRPFFVGWQSNRLIPTIVVFLCLIPSVKAMQATHAYFDFNKCIYNEIRQSPTECVVQARAFDTKSRYVYGPSLSADRNDFHNRVKAFYYNKKYIQALPSDLFEFFSNPLVDSLISIPSLAVSDYQLYDYSKYWIVPITHIPSRRVYATYQYLSDNESLRVRQRIVRYVLKTIDKGRCTVPCYGIESAGRPFMILPKNGMDINRIKVISIDSISCDDDNQKIVIVLSHR